MERIQDIGGETFIQQESEEIVTVMTGGFEPYFHFAQILCYRAKHLIKLIEADLVIGYRENVAKDMPFGIHDKAVMLVLGNVDTDTDHLRYLRQKDFDAVGIHRALCSCNLVRNKPSYGI